MKPKLNSIVLLLLLALSLFIVIPSFASKSIPSVYMTIAGCLFLSALVLIVNFKQEKLIYSSSELLLGIIVLGCIGLTWIHGNLSPLVLLSSLSLLFFYGIIKKTAFQKDGLVVGLVLLGIPALARFCEPCEYSK